MTGDEAVEERGIRKSRRVKKSKDLAEYVVSDDEVEGKVSSVESEDMSEDELIRPKRVNKPKFVHQRKEKILDLEAIYAGENLVETVPAVDFDLPPHLRNLTYYPHTETSWDYLCAEPNPSAIPLNDQDGEPINIDRNWWLVSTILSRRVRLAHLNTELMVTKGTVSLDLPRLLKNHLGLNIFHVRSRRLGQVRSVYHQSLVFTFDFKKMNLEEAIDDFIATNQYFKDTFPTTTTMETYPKEFIKIVNQNTGKLVPGLQKKLIINRSVSYYLENPKSDLPISVGCPDFMEEIDPGWFKLVCVEDEKNPVTQEKSLLDILTHEVYANIHIYFDISKFHLLPVDNFKKMHAAFKTNYAHAILSTNIPRVVEDKKLKTTALNALEGSTLQWMKNVVEQKEEEEAHVVTFAESSTILRFEAIPDKLVNMKEGVIVDKVSGHFLEKDYAIYGGVILADLQRAKASPKRVSKRAKAPNSAAIEGGIKSTLRNLAITLIYQCPVASVADLSMSDFQKNFMIPSLATLIVTRETQAIAKWQDMIDSFNIRFQASMSVIVLDSIHSFKAVTWDDVLHADIVICADKLLGSFTTHLNQKGYRVGSTTNFYFSGTSKSDIFYQRAGDSNVVDTNYEPTELLHMKEKIQNLEAWFRVPGSVDLQGVYWHRVVYDMVDEHQMYLPYGADWKWVIGTESASTYSSFLTSCLTNKQFEEFELLSFKNRFIRSITPYKSLPAPKVLKGVSLKSIVPGESRAEEEEESSPPDKKGKGKAFKRKVVDGPEPKSKRAREDPTAAGPSNGGGMVDEEDSEESDPLQFQMRNVPSYNPGSPIADLDGFESDEDAGSEDGDIFQRARYGNGNGPEYAMDSDQDQEEQEDQEEEEEDVVEGLPPVIGGFDYSVKIAQLANMGFEDVTKCRDALVRYDGDIDRALNFMLG